MEEFTQYQMFQYSKNLWFISSLRGSLHMYLLIGERAALMVDTGFGFINLPELAGKVTDKPIWAVNTHGHHDHTGGNGWFEKVYMAREASEDMGLGNEGLPPIELPHEDYERIIVDNSDIIDLGGIRLEVIKIPAHAKSSIALLDRHHRLLFTGDEAEAGQVLLFGYEDEDSDHKIYAKQHMENMKRLKSYEKDFDFLCAGHNGTPISKGYLDAYIGLDAAIINDTAQKYPLDHIYLAKSPFASELVRVREGNASIVYRDKGGGSL